MRRFFGLAPKSSTERSAALEQVTVAPTPQVHARGVRNGPDDAPPVPPKHSDPRAGAERASSDGHDDEDEIVLSSRRSRHVNFVASPAPSLPHPLQHQPSIESSHGGPLACFPRTSNASTLAPSSSARSPTSSGSSDQIHRPLPPGPPQSSTSHSASTSYLSHSQARTGSSLSRVASSVGTSPYGLNSYPSLSKLAHDGGGRDTVITNPTTWSEMVSEDLVDNLSDRERTRQEVLFEVVASEERYVLELRSLFHSYVQPLLHPALPSATYSNTSSLSLPSSTTPRASYSREELPIAAKFLRAINADVDERTVSQSWGQSTEIPDMDGSSDSHQWKRTLKAGNFASYGRSRQSLPVLPRSNLSDLSHMDDTASAPVSPRSKLAAIPFRVRHPLRRPLSTTKLHKKVPPEELEPPVLPQGLRDALEVIEGMLEGHERLATELRRRWTADFPLVRGLGAVWSDQPWFGNCYSAYILSLESALEAIDACLPTSHSPNAPFYSATSRPKTQSDKEEKRLARFIMTLEERAHEAGECSLGISILKPLMRLGKLPLLMQSIFYHTDPSTVEYERTRAMALEIDHLVRSIENEVLQEDERERVRDVFARIEQIKDKNLMAPRSTRVLISETSVWDPPATPMSSSTSTVSRRAVSDVASHPPVGLASSHRNVSALSSHSNRSIRRLSELVRSASTASTEKAPGLGSKRDLWIIRFSDVTIRCARVGTTDIPGGFARSKETGKGKIRKKGKQRNLYRFLRVEKWDHDPGGRQRMENGESARMRLGGDDSSIRETSDEEEDEFDDAESRMSFSYDNDEPTENLAPLPTRTFKGVGLGRSTSTSSRSIVAKDSPAQAKFGSRLRHSEGGWSDARSTATPSPGVGSRPRFDAATEASRARSTTLTLPGPRLRAPTLMPSSQLPLPRTLVPRRSSFTPSTASTAPRSPSSSVTSTPDGSPLIQTPPTTHTPLRGLAHAREDSSLKIYSAFWNQGDDGGIRFPSIPIAQTM